MISGAGKQPDLQMRFVPAVPVTADGINAYVAFSKIKAAGDYWPSGWALQLLNIQPKFAPNTPADMPVVLSTAISACLSGRQPSLLG